MRVRNRFGLAAAVALQIAVPIAASQDVSQIAEVAQKPPSTTRPTQAPPSQRPVPTPAPPMEGPPIVNAVQVTPAATRPDQPTTDSLGLRGFSVALVLGEMQGSSAAETLPAGAKRALNDMRDFLPYKNYRILDVQWTLCCSGRATGISGRLRGMEEDDHPFQIILQGVVGSKLSVFFRLLEPDHGDHAVAAAVSSNVESARRVVELKNKRERMEAEVAAARQRLGEHNPDVVSRRTELENAKREIEALERSSKGEGKEFGARGRGRYILESAFQMDVGETVVIGTSRLKGDKALIALLTAASRSSTGAR